jgi:hypothetical protein
MTSSRFAHGVMASISFKDRSRLVCRLFADHCRSAKLDCLCTMAARLRNRRPASYPPTAPSGLIASVSP